MGKLDGRNSIQNRTMQAELAKCNEVRRKSIYTEIRKENNLGIDWKHVKMFNFLKNSLLLKILEN